jgi:hypothetical protein
MNSFARYVQFISEYLQDLDGYDLAPLLSYQHAEHATSERVVCESAAMMRAHLKHIPSPWDEFVLLHMRGCVLLLQNQFVGAYKEQASLVQSFTKYLQTIKDENWMLPVLNVIIRDLRLLAIAADLETSLPKVSLRGDSTGSSLVKPHQHLERSADLLMGLFRICATDIRVQLESSKRLSMMHIINQLFKIYFKINKLHLCKPLIRALENAKLGDCFPRAQQVTYDYFLGMKSMLDAEYKMAADLFSRAFTNCHPDSFKNRRLVLIFLIPVKMLLGQMPTERLLREYDLLQHFAPVVSAVKKGHLREFDQALEQNSDFFWAYGIYLILEKLKIIAFRNVFKKIALISSTHQIPIEHFRVATEFVQGEPFSFDEVHCILANLIYDGKIKGYISLQHQKLVVSKQNPFPNLASVSG